MFVRLVYESFRRQKRRKLLAGIAVALGVAIATAMIAVATDVGDKINRELRTYGANLVVTPQEDTLDVEIGGVNFKPAAEAAYLRESDLPKIKGIFWRNNVVGFSPMLPVDVEVAGRRVTLVGTYFAKRLTYGKEQFSTGVRVTHPWWKVAGTWPGDDSQDVLVGESLAAKFTGQPKDAVTIGGTSYRVAGVLSTGGDEDNQIVAPLALAQKILGKAGVVRRIFVSALTKPEDDFARRDPESMSPAMRDRWFCSPYPQSIAYQLQGAISNSHAEMVRQVAHTEGAVLSRITGLMLLIALAALLASALAVSSAMATAIFQRRAEVGLMKSLGAGNLMIASLFFFEAALLALIGGLAGFGGGALLARQIGRSIFASQIQISPVLLPIVLAVAVLVTFAGSAVAIRRAVRFDPVHALRGEA
ncbi:MAG TPA: ABC transporter permease [Terriglobales bacterium]|jgi:putative ABC transport system permease protein